MRLLVISAHADDETLGCGGTLLRHRAAGDEAHWLVVSSRTEPRWSAAAVEEHGRQRELAVGAYGFAGVTGLGHADAALEAVPLASLVEQIVTVVERVRPEVVYVVHGGDVHSDHALVSSATMAALKAFRMIELGVRRVLAYETLSSTDAAVQDLRHAFLPTVFHDVTGFVPGKCEVMGLYRSELQPGWRPRSASAITALARYRGASIGVEHAEAFVLLREVA